MGYRSRVWIRIRTGAPGEVLLRVMQQDDAHTEPLIQLLNDGHLVMERDGFRFYCDYWKWYSRRLTVPAGLPPEIAKHYTTYTDIEALEALYFYAADQEMDAIFIRLGEDVTDIEYMSSGEGYELASINIDALFID